MAEGTARAAERCCSTQNILYNLKGDVVRHLSRSEHVFVRQSIRKVYQDLEDRKRSIFAHTALSFPWSSNGHPPRRKPESSRDRAGIGASTKHAVFNTRKNVVRFLV